MRPSEPKSVGQWRKQLEELACSPPKCCHTCEYYTLRGECVKFKMLPPADFAAEDGACSEWEQETPVPF